MERCEMDRRVRHLLLFVILLLALFLRLKGVTNPLLDDQAWRQCDTASIATHMMGRLTDFPRVFLPELNYDGVVPQIVELEFPFLPYLLAWVWSIFGWADIWGRLLTITLSLVTVLGIYDLGRHIFTDRAGLFAAAIYAFMPLSVYYGRVIMPEGVAQAWSIWALALTWRWKNSNQEKGIWGVALVMSGAILAKLPQLMLLPVALLMGFYPLKLKQLGKVVYYCALVLILPVAFYLWVHFNVAPSSQYISGILTEQVAGSTNSDLLSLENNLRQGFSAGLLSISFVGLTRLFLVRSPVRVPFLVWGGIILLYIELVCAHIPLDYYLVPALPLIALLSAYALDGIPDVPGSVCFFLVLVLISLSCYNNLTPKYQWNPEYLIQAKWIEQHTPPASILILSDSPPMTFYYSKRVGFRLNNVSDESNPIQQIEQIPGDYLVRLPQSEHKELFWEKIGLRYQEVGPGVFELKKL